MKKKNLRNKKKNKTLKSKKMIKNQKQNRVLREMESYWLTQI